MHPKKKKKPNKNNLIKNSPQITKYARYSSVVFQMIAIVLVVLWGGIELDKYLENKFPIFTLIGAVGGVVLSVYYAIKEFTHTK